MLFANKHKTQNTFILSYYRLVTAELFFILTRFEPYTHQTKPRNPWEYRLLPHTHHLPSLSWCRSLCQKWELFFVEPEVKSQWAVLVGYLTISTNLSCYQIRRRQYYLPFSNTAHVCTSARCAQHSSTAAAQNSQLHFSWAMTPTGQSWTQLIKRFRESIAACNLTKLKKLSSNLLNARKTVIQYMSEKKRFRVSVFC